MFFCVDFVHQVWCIYHCNLVAKKVLSILEASARNKSKELVRELNGTNSGGIFWILISWNHWRNVDEVDEQV